jgi:ABC-type transport system substrate-binding protein
MEWMKRLLAVLVALLAACGGTAATEATATPEVSPTPAPTRPAPTPQDPLVPARVTELGDGTVLLVVPADEPQVVDPLDVAAKDGIQPPACAGFVFVTSWLVVSPYPPGDTAIEVTATRQGAQTVVGTSPSGGATTGCEVLEFANLSGGPIVIEVRYVLAELG